jgi:hypothetical protein
MDLIALFKELAAKTEDTGSGQAEHVSSGTLAQSINVAPVQAILACQDAPTEVERYLQIGWDLETADLSAWLEKVSVPSEEIRLDSRLKVIEPERFISQLKREALQGPTGPRARSGVLQLHLRRYKEAVQRQERA